LYVFLVVFFVFIFVKLVQIFYSQSEWKNQWFTGMSETRDETEADKILYNIAFTESLFIRFLIYEL